MKNYTNLRLYDLVRNLALEYPKSALNDGPLLVYLTARNRERGEQAIQALQADEQLKRRSALQAQGGQTDVKYHSLDVSEKKSVDGFVEYLKTEHPEGVDFVINNAGIAMNGFGE